MTRGMNFGSRLRQLRQSKTTGLKTLAKKVGVDHSYLSRIESNRVQPSEQVIRKLARSLNYDEAELMLLADRVPPTWRTAIKRDPECTASTIRDSLAANMKTGNGSTGYAQELFPSNGIRAVESETSINELDRRKSPSGVPTNDLIFSSHVGTNDELFPEILSLYVKPGSTVADVTYGKGVFWKQVPPKSYKLLATDISKGVDCRSLPYKNSSLDCVVLDPPYMHTPGGTAHVGHQNFEGYYGNNRATNGSSKKYHEAVLDLYFATGAEAYRVLRNEGIFIVKCADEVCANRQRLTHVELINEYAQNGFIVEDLFVLVRRNRPGVSRMIQQMHARKNHSYFLVFRKSNGKTRWAGPKWLSFSR